MIQKTVYIKIKPSQIINLETFVLSLLAIPFIIYIDDVMKEYLPLTFISNEIKVHLYRFPTYLSAFVLINLIYKGFQVYCIQYEVDSEELRCYSGIFRRKHEIIELYRVKDFLIERPLIHRLLGLGNLTIYTSDKTTPVLRMQAIKEPEEKYKILRGLVELNRREKHVFEVD